MTTIISKCNPWGKFLDSKRELREHLYIDKNHRIANSKIIMCALIQKNEPIRLLLLLRPKGINKKRLGESSDKSLIDG
ncbi:MAG: hypothetical protein ACJ71D_09905 [Nitrososphaera sp.]